jgi:hypothetical protein
MAAILITYDLNKPGQGYTDLYEAIKGLGAWWHYLDSTWIVSGYSLTATTVWNALQPHIDKNDSVFIVDITRDAHSGWLPQKAWDWINKNV